MGCQARRITEHQMLAKQFPHPDLDTHEVFSFVPSLRIRKLNGYLFAIGRGNQSREGKDNDGSGCDGGRRRSGSWKEQARTGGRRLRAGAVGSWSWRELELGGAGAGGSWS